MPFKLKGFLSDDMASWIAKHRRDHADWFELSNRINLVAQSMVRSIELPSDDNHRLVKALLLLRGISSYQAALLLTERGLTTEARTLCRSTFETLFYLGALQKDPAFLDDIIGEDAAQRKKIARALTELPVGSGLEPDQIDILKEFMLSIEASDVAAKAIGIETAAIRPGLQDMYNTYYRGLSNDSSHPSLEAMGRHLNKDTSGIVQGIYWSPESPNIGDTLSVVCTAGMYLIVFAIETFPPSNEVSDLENLWETYRSLIDRSEPVQAPSVTIQRS